MSNKGTRAMFFELPEPACAHCGRATHYMLTTSPGVTVPCCGRFACEMKLRDGADVPDRPPTKTARELVDELVTAAQSVTDDALRGTTGDVEASQARLDALTDAMVARLERGR